MKEVSGLKSGGIRTGRSHKCEENSLKVYSANLKLYFKYAKSRFMHFISCKKIDFRSYLCDKYLS